MTRSYGHWEYTFVYYICPLRALVWYVMREWVEPDGRVLHVENCFLHRDGTWGDATPYQRPLWEKVNWQEHLPEYFTSRGAAERCLYETVMREESV